MRIVLVLKPYAVEVYSFDKEIYTLVGIEQITRIANESLQEYEKRMVYVCKDLSMDMRSSSFFKNISKTIECVDIVLSAPWCVYDVVQVEKNFDKPTIIDQKLLVDMQIRKVEETVHVIESYTSNILLNGYEVQTINGQSAQSVQFQYVHIYANTSFVSLLIKTIESIFHTHKVILTSVYSLIEKKVTTREKTHIHELRVILEEESLDISYISEGVTIVSMFVPHSYMHLEDAIGLQLGANRSQVYEVLKSRSEYAIQLAAHMSIQNNAKKIWQNLDTQIQTSVDTAILEHMEKVLKSIRDCIDTIATEQTKDFIYVHLFCMNKKMVSVYGEDLALHIQNDPYITTKIHVVPGPITVDAIF